MRLYLFNTFALTNEIEAFIEQLELHELEHTASCIDLSSELRGPSMHNYCLD